MQAPLRFLHGSLLVVADFDFGHAGAPIKRKHGNGLAIDVEKIQRHAVPFEDFHFDDRLRVLVTAQVFVDADGCTLAVGHTVDNQARSEHAITTGEDARSRCHKRLRVYRNQAAWGDFDAIFRLQEVQAWRLADGHDDGVAFYLRLTVLKKRRVETLIPVEYPLGLQHLKSDYFAALAQHSFGSEPRMQNDSFCFGFFNFL